MCSSGHFWQEKRTKALANVAWPHSATSVAGVNHLRSKPWALRTKNAVSDKLFSAATAWRIESSTQRSKKQTAAGLPAKTCEVKASTWYSGILIFSSLVERLA